ncbi:toll/interleukin-1 receptor domain-containing protein [uncultured Nostoc sp.]|uniref:toll/interleukin-1 receptor domain-containing protein n=1 Tax=uncultured Nostoc sp. TaxID=340711 RepID=UPI00262ADB15|nr:toll/interleukin-1 receptor domain-containing protein [uncultured Nostoc sp.]
MDDQEALQRTLNRTRRALQILEEQKAGFGIRVPVDLQIELEEKQKEVASLEARLSHLKKSIGKVESESKQKEVFISYTWRDNHSETFVQQLEKAFQAKGIIIIRDKNAIGYKERFQEFMQRLSRGKCVIVVISDQYLKSENCMYELIEIAKNGKLYHRIFPIVLADAQIYKPIERIKYVEYWEKQIQDLNDAMRTVSAANLQGFREEIDLYSEIRNMFANLINLLKDMNALTEEIHIQSNFEALLKAIAESLDE